jgi:hypothetical protein
MLRHPLIIVIFAIIMTGITFMFFYKTFSPYENCLRVRFENKYDKKSSFVGNENHMYKQDKRPDRIANVRFRFMIECNNITKW